MARLKTRPLGRNIRVLLTRSGCTQAKLGEACGVSQSQVSKWIRDRNEPSADQLIDIAMFFGVSIDEILLESMDAKNPRDLATTSQVRKITGKLGPEESYRRLLGVRATAASASNPAMIITHHLGGNDIAAPKRRCS